MLCKPNPDQPMHQMTLPTIDGKSVTVSGSNNRWQMIVVYRGLNCPICKVYTAKIEDLKDKFDELAEDAKKNCPISGALNCEINITGSLV